MTIIQSMMSKLYLQRALFISTQLPSHRPKLKIISPCNDVENQFKGTIENLRRKAINRLHSPASGQDLYSCMKRVFDTRTIIDQDIEDFF